MMPRMDGYELTRALRAIAEYRDVPIVMVTSRGERIDRVRGFDAGVDEYITKPHDRHAAAQGGAQACSATRGRQGARLVKVDARWPTSRSCPSSCAGRSSRSATA